MAAFRRVLAGAAAAVLALALAGEAAAAVESMAQQGRQHPLREPHMPGNLAGILGKGGSLLLELAGEASRSLLRTATQGGEPAAVVDKANATACASGELQRAMAAGAVAARAVAGMPGWDRMQMGLWLAQTGMDGYEYQMNMWKLVGAGMPY